jgi:hypothetical protein
MPKFIVHHMIAPAAGNIAEEVEADNADHAKVLIEKKYGSDVRKVEPAAKPERKGDDKENPA